MSKLTRFLSGTVFVAVLLLGGTALPANAAGLSTVQINAILSLLSSFGADQSVINNVQASLTGSAPISGQSWCHSFNTNLGIGTRSTEIGALITALSRAGNDTGTGSSDPTPLFNELVAAAVTGFQEKYASEILTPNGLQHGTGYVGASTRVKLNSLYGCHSGQPTTPTTTTASSTSTISISPTSGPIGTTVTLSGNFSVCDVNTDPSECTVNRFNQLVFIQNGVATPVNYISSPTRTIQIPDSFSPGVYQLAMQNCLGSCSTYKLTTFTVTSGTASSYPPVWGAVNGPSAMQPLIVNQQGTWNMTASDSTGGNLSYSVNWGDSTPVVTQQSPIFTHSYSQVGEYTPEFTVTNSAGQTVQTGMYLCVEAGPITTSCK